MRITEHTPPAMCCRDGKADARRAGKRAVILTSEGEPQTPPSIRAEGEKQQVIKASEAKEATDQRG